MSDEIELIGSGDEIELISDGDGLAIIGKQTTVEQFLTSHSLDSRDLGLARLRGQINTASGVAQVGSEVSAKFGRWAQLTEKSAKDLKTYGAMSGSSSDVSRAVVMNKGKIKGIVEFAKTTPKVALTNPALLAGAAGLMAQLAMQQAMDEITDYLAVIDAKVNDVLRAQKDAALAEMIGVDFAIQEAMTIREEVGRVSDITWSKIQATPVIIGQTQAYALRQVDGLAEKLERTQSIGDLAELTRSSEKQAQEWLAVLASCFQLQDAISVLELDRVFDESPEELERHRKALRVARDNRLKLISRSASALVSRIEAAGKRANKKVLLNPFDARTVVISGQQIVADVIVFQEHIGIEAGEHSLHARRWRDAVADVRNKVVDTGADGISSIKRMSVDTADWAKSTAEKVSEGISERIRDNDDDLQMEDEVPWVLEPVDEDE